MNYSFFDIKVNRLMKPQIYPDLPEQASLAEGKIIRLGSDENKAGRTGTNPGKGEKMYVFHSNELLEVLSQFPAVFVGENLQLMAFLKCTWGNPIDYVKINVSVELEAKKHFYTIKNESYNSIREGSEISFPLDIKIEENDTHTLIFDLTFRETPVSYPNQQGVLQPAEKTFVRRLKMTSKLPFVYEYRGKPLGDNYYVEYTLKNVSPSVINFRKMDFKALDFYTSKRMEAGITGYDNNVLGPEDTKKLIFCVNFKNETSKSDHKSGKKKEIQMGNLFLEWNTCGIYIAPQIAILINPKEVEFELDNPPQTLFLEEITMLKMNCINNSPMKYDLSLSLNDEEAKGLKILGLSAKEVTLQPGQTGNFYFYVFPSKTGIQRLHGLRVTHQNKDLRLGKFELVVDSKLNKTAKKDPREAVVEQMNLLD